MHIKRLRYTACEASLEEYENAWRLLQVTEKAIMSLEDPVMMGQEPKWAPKQASTPMLCTLCSLQFLVCPCVHNVRCRFKVDLGLCLPDKAVRLLP